MILMSYYLSYSPPMEVEHCHDAGSTTESSSEPVVTGRRIIDIDFFFQQIRDISDHEPLGTCDFRYMKLTSEVQKGAVSVFTFKCSMCHIIKKISTSQEATTPSSEADVTKSLVFGAITIGAGWSQLQQQMGILNIPSLSQRRYQKCQEEVSLALLDTSTECMITAGQEEGKLARELGEVDKDGYPLISVIADGAWSKRSYKTDYSALSGVVSKTSVNVKQY